MPHTRKPAERPSIQDLTDRLEAVSEEAERLRNEIRQAMAAARARERLIGPSPGRRRALKKR